MFLDGDFESIANGWNDGHRMAIASDSLSSIVVEIHEATHGRIFNQTPDGQLHKICILAGRSAIDRQQNGIYSNASKIMFVDSKVAHEAGATYLAIQSLHSKKARKEAFKELNKDYKKYYNILSGLIEPIVKTSWLRYAFAWTLIHWAFHSKRMTEFFKDESPSLQPFKEIASPTHRLYEVSRRLKKGSFGRRWIRESLAKTKESFLSHGRPLWDIDDEGAWDKLGGAEDVQLFENLLTSFAGDWLLDNIDIETHDFRSDVLDFGPGFNALLKRLGFEPEHIITRPESVLDAEWRNRNVEFQALNHSRDIIEHHPTVIPLDLTGLKPTEILESVREYAELSNHCTVLSAIEDDDSKSILAFRRKSGEPNTYQYENVATVILDNVVVPIAMQVIANANKDIDLKCLFRVRRETIMIAVSRIVKTFYFEDEGALRRMANLSTAMLYMDGPWSQVYRLEGVEVGSRYVGLVDVEGEEAKPVSLHVATGPGEFFDFFVNLKPRWSGHHLMKYEEFLSSGGSIKLFNIDDAQLGNLMSSLRDAWHIWTKF